MKKPWVCKRKNIKGHRAGWYEGGRREAKTFQSTSPAEHLRHLKCMELDSGVFTSVVDFTGVIWARGIDNSNGSKVVPSIDVPWLMES
jgi:hypothetical protein